MDKRKPNWKNSEINTLLDLMLEEKVTEKMDDKKTRSKESYKLLKNKLLPFGYDRDEDQIKFKFQKLKSLQMSSNNNKSGSRRMEDSFYNKLEILIRDRPASSFKYTVFESREESSASNTVFGTDANDSMECIIEEGMIENIPPTSRGCSRKNKSYQAVVKSMTGEIKSAMKQETEKLITSLDKMQKDDHDFLREIQSNDQTFILQLFGEVNTAPQHIYYRVE